MKNNAEKSESQSGPVFEANVETFETSNNSSLSTANNFMNDLLYNAENNCVNNLTVNDRLNDGENSASQYSENNVKLKTN